VETDRIWNENPALVRQFLAQRPSYEELCGEIVYLLKRQLREASIEVAAIVSRAKSLESFLEKLERKKYGDPGKVTDLAGVRVVCLFKGDLAQVEAIVSRDFRVIERIDKTAEHEVDRFGYEGVHFLVKLGESQSGARYDHLRESVCEIQVRTLAQDVWAVIDHHLRYKREASIPKDLRRQIHGLAGLFDTADDQFQQIRESRERYMRELAVPSPAAVANIEELNLDSLRAFCKITFSDRKVEEAEPFDRVLGWLVANGYRTLDRLEAAIMQAADRLQVLREMPTLSDDGMWTDLFCVHVSVAIVDRSYRDSSGLSGHIRAGIASLE